MVPAPSKHLRPDASLADLVARAVVEHVHRAAYRRGGVGEAGPGPAVSGQVLGLVGLSPLALAIAERARDLGMRVVAWDQDGDGTAPAGVRPARCAAELAGGCHHLVVTPPRDPPAGPLVDEALLDHAHPDLHVIDVTRGACVDHAALAVALRRGRLAAATLDAAGPGPLRPDHPLRRCPGVRIAALC